ncbi:MAG: Gfo/Idh/MocA family oxidoreductase, partial [Pseudomonadota bacterium]
MTQTVNYGVIGCGMMGQEHLRNIALLDGARVSAVFEPNAAMADAASAIAPGAQIVGSVDALLAVDALECILIASPNFCHVAQMEEIAAKRPLPLLVEKPLFTDPEDAERLMVLRDGYTAPI